jgi:GrpB-like predicted nucleotidyltransferase (UPF0157 family)
MVSADPIVVVPYDHAWPSLYEEERARIERAIGPWVERIEHVGSTAVQELAAKPVIDIMVGVKSLDDSAIPSNASRASATSTCRSSKGFCPSGATSAR